MFESLKNRVDAGKRLQIDIGFGFSRCFQRLACLSDISLVSTLIASNYCDRD
jgi:hypothetical protein